MKKMLFIVRFHLFFLFVFAFGNVLFISRSCFQSSQGNLNLYIYVHIYILSLLSISASAFPL